MKYFSIAVFVLCIATLAACGGTDTDQNTTSSQSSSAEAQAEMNATVNSTFAGLLTAGKSAECTFTQEDEGNVTTGTVWIEAAAERMAGDFTFTPVGGNAQEVHIIATTDMRYVWGDSFEQGIMMGEVDVNEGLFAGMNTDTQVNSTVDDETIIEFDCDDWNVDDDKFNPPSDVEFMDMTATVQQMNDIQIDANGSVQADCSLCDMVPEGEGRSACLAQLGC